MAPKVQTVRRTAGADVVQIKGLRELVAALGEFDKSMVRQVRQGNRTVGELVADRARTRAQMLGGVAEHVAPSIRAKADARYGVVTGGGPKYPEFFGANFGARHDVERETPRGPMKGWNQFKPFTKGNDEFLYRTIADLSPRAIEDRYLEVFEPLFRLIEGH
jgi:hypothetical protein